ncbi:DUF5695 domain-containing protein [Sphingomonas oryzagri]|uniref:DUF5695 domain-containing protein n=1 Tax=Sphingomonas oryzagri TaxID=3042314 RepID=A0ABT6N792_9SPHN|nr:DUF5695 domain-containing protein [Sphingomonas oryzagri]MDH7640978.1 DUF5695 domain-containing protein [Sphingomonas oryzagri]
MSDFSRREMVALSAALPLVAQSGTAGATQPKTHPSSASALSLTLCPQTGVAIGLTPPDAGPFSFVPKRKAPVASGLYALGDIDIRYRTGGDWQDLSSAFHRAQPRALAPASGEIAAAELPLPPSSPLTVTRHWLHEGGDLVLRFTLRNRSAAPVEIGGLGLAMPFDNILTGRTLEQAHEQACFADPYVGLDAGYLQVTRLNGKGPALLVLPEAGTPFEAYMPIADGTGDGGAPALLKDSTKRELTFEGFYRWMIASKGFADREWRGADQWNTPTAFTLQPGEARTVGVRFVLAPSIRGIETRLEAAGRPVAIGIPGYVLPADLPGDLFVRAAGAITIAEVSPAGALAVSDAGMAGGWRRFRIEGKGWGRARLTLHHADGGRQAIHYFVTKPAETASADLGRFLFTRQWYEDEADRFGRSPSIMSYDRERDAIVTQEKRVWIAGLSDEGGAGSWLAAIMKQLDNPVAEEVAKFERFHVGVIERHLQTPDYGVRKSLFHYDPTRPQDYDPAIDWTTWAAWKPDQANSIVRSFNYVHVAAAQWVLYRLARNRTGLVTAHDWRWYLERAANTAIAMPKLAPDYVKFGQMEGDVFVAILADLRREGMATLADPLEAAMRERAKTWSSEAYPFGSEMPWDSTGQEEVYVWMRHFGDEAKAALAREVILGYDPLIPHWGYNGSARRYWDFLFAGKTARIERQLHHYGSSLNAIPLFDSFRRDPADIHLLRVAYGGLMGSLTNIDRDGFGACAFHSYPDMMRFDAYSGDYGMSYFGHAFATASYLVRHPDFGWVGFGGVVSEGAGRVSIAPKDSARSRLFLASEKLWLVLEAGRIAEAHLDPATGEIELVLDAADAHTPAARLVIEGGHRLSGSYGIERGAHVVPLGTGQTRIRLARA